MAWTRVVSVDKPEIFREWNHTPLDGLDTNNGIMKDSWVLGLSSKYQQMLLGRMGVKQILGQGKSATISRYLNFETAIRNLTGDTDYLFRGTRQEFIVDI